MELPAYHQLQTLQTIDAVAINPQQLYQTMSLKEIQGMANATNEQGNGLGRNIIALPLPLLLKQGFFQILQYLGESEVETF